MFDFLIYLAQSALCLAALYLIFKVAMSHETLHIFNRIILLGSIILSALLPLCRVKVVKEYDAAPTVASIEVDDMVVVESVPELGIDFVSLFKDIAVAAFIVGVAFMLVRWAVSTYSVWRLIHSGRMSVIEEDVTLTVVSKISTPFSWFGHIVASEEDMKVYRDMILSHELAHIRLRHSWDVLFVDLALCLWWFNPAMWLLRRELQNLHEYQADDAVLNGGVDAKSYQMLLIKRAVGSRLHSVANCLNHSNLNNRITMMCKKNSSRWSAAKALLVLPVVAISLSAFATTVYVPREVQGKVTQNSVNDKDSRKSVLKISGEKIYLDNEQITIDQLKERVHAYNEISLQADGNTSMGVVADVKNVLRENGALKLTYEQINETPRPIYVVDGRVVPADDVSNIDVNKIATISSVRKDYDELLSKYNISEEQAKNGVVVITLKKEGEGDDTAVLDIATEDNVIAIAEQGNAKSENIKVEGYSARMKSSEQEQDPPFIKVEKMPTFNGGGNLVVFQNWIQNNIRYPKEAMEKGIGGRVIFQFVVERDGTPTSFNVLQSPAEKSLIDEVERVFKTSPKWEAGEQNGEKVRVIYTVPVVFTALNTSANDAAKSSALVPLGDNQPYIKVEKMPTFQGSDLNVFRNWVQSQIQYPAEAMEKNISGRVIFSFVVEKDGSTSSYEVLSSPDKILADEVERIFKSCPKWEPGTQRGEKVRVKYTVPIVFAVQK